MNVRLAVFLSHDILKRIAGKNPEKIITIAYEDGRGDYADHSVSVKEAEKALQDLINHVYPDSESDRYKLITRCCDCMNYKTKRKRNNPRVKKQVCKLDDLPKEKDFYCAYAMPKSKEY